MSQSKMTFIYSVNPCSPHLYNNKPITSLISTELQLQVNFVYEEEEESELVRDMRRKQLGPPVAVPSGTDGSGNISVSPPPSINIP